MSAGPRPHSGLMRSTRARYDLSPAAATRHQPMVRPCAFTSSMPTHWCSAVTRSSALWRLIAKRMNGSMIIRTVLRDEFLPKEAMSPERILGIDATMRDAIDFKFVQAPLSKEQLAELIQIPPRAK